MKNNSVPELQRMAIWKRQILTLKKNSTEQTGMQVERWEEVEWENGGRNCSCKRWDFRSLDFTTKIRKETCSLGWMSRNQEPWEMLRGGKGESVFNK